MANYEFDEDEPTVIEVTADNEETPVEPPLCVECGKVSFADSADLISSYPFDRCLHSARVMPPGHPSAGKHGWHWCKTLLKSVSYDDRK